MHISLFSVPPITEKELPTTRTTTVRPLQTACFWLGKQESVDTHNLRIEKLPHNRYQLWRISQSNATKMRLDGPEVITPEGRCVDEDFLKSEYNQHTGPDEIIELPVTPR